jgi:pimeloyl-ACP methyl ester carboxylesterase
MNNKLLLFALAAFATYNVAAQTYEGKYLEANYDESKVPAFKLPDVLASFEGKSIQTVEDWEKIRRPEIVDFFAQNMFGEVPTPLSPIKKSFRLIAEDPTIFNGLCTRKDVLVTFENEIGKVTMPLVLFIPSHTKDKVPVILLANGDDIKRNRLQLNNSQKYGETENGIPLHQLMIRGIGLATIDYKAFGTDDGNKEGKVSGGISTMFFKEDQEFTKENEWGMIAIWAYALRAGMDYLEKDKDINENQVATLGNSIGGKVALWAAITDLRFGMTLLATAGHGGDAIWRREYGETLQNMCDHLPTWICRNAKKYAGNVHDLPVDQHSLLAAMAPRPFYVSNAQHDLWADQKGQWLGTYNAAPSYRLYKRNVAFTSDKQPALNQPIIKSSIGYHVRSGVHGLELYDWEQYMKFIEYHFLKIEPRTVGEVYR